MDSQWRIIGLINNYSKMSFNFGPTLLYWLERHKPSVYQSILDADKESMNNFSGHGSAIAQVYNHMIMPLANRRDKETQVIWGIKDFEARFKRYPEGMWLPETAVDIETLEVLAENKIKFTILSPHQAVKIRKIGQQEWLDVSNVKIDPRRGYLCRLPSGKSINVFFFDKKTASDIAFGNLLDNGEAFAKRLIDAFKDHSDESRLESVASDGELYGHHHPHGDMTLAYCLYYISTSKNAKLTNFGEYLEKHLVEYEAAIQENTSWSCVHGIERWRSDDGCNTGRNGWKQAWRKPLREAMDWLRDKLAPNFESEAGKYLKNPWQARNEYIDIILDRSKENVEAFLSKHAQKELSEEDKRRVIKLLEMQRHAMLMYTSCGWFFDEISGIETVQVMMYAARAIQLARELFSLELEKQYTESLGKAPSNIMEFENGSKVYSVFVKPAVVDFAKISAQHTITALFSTDLKSRVLTEQRPNCCFRVTETNLERREEGRFRLVVNRLQVYSDVTLDEESFGNAAIWLGDHNVSCGALRNMNEANFASMRSEAIGFFEKGQINEIFSVFSRYFKKNTYTLKDIFRDDQLCILDFIISDGLKRAKELFDIVYQDNSAMLRFMKENRIPSPKPFLAATEVVLNMEIERLLSPETIELESLKKLIGNTKDFAITVDPKLLAFKASQKITHEISVLSENPESMEKLERARELIKIVHKLPIELNLWEAQNIAFNIAKKNYKKMKDNKEDQAKQWVANFRELCGLIGIRLD